MRHTDPILARPPVFACTATHGGLDAAWVNVPGELDIPRHPPGPERNLSADGDGDADLSAPHASASVLLTIHAREDLEIARQVRAALGAQATAPL